MEFVIYTGARRSGKSRRVLENVLRATAQKPEAKTAVICGLSSSDFLAEVRSILGTDSMPGFHKEGYWLQLATGGRLYLLLPSDPEAIKHGAFDAVGLMQTRGVSAAVAVSAFYAVLDRNGSVWIAADPVRSSSEDWVSKLVRVATVGLVDVQVEEMEATVVRVDPVARARVEKIALLIDPSAAE